MKPVFRERDISASYADGGPGFSTFDRRIEQDGLWYDLSVEARRLYACGYLVLERRGLVEATQRELMAATGLAPKCVVRARRELEEKGLIRILRGYTGTKGDVVEMVAYAPSMPKAREREVHEEKKQQLGEALTALGDLTENAGYQELQRKFGGRRNAS